MSVFNLEILLPDKKIFAGEIISLNVPAEDGRLGILAHHAPLVSVLKKGELQAKLKDGKNYSYELDSGILRVENNCAQVFTG